MVLDIQLFRASKGGDPELVRESQRRRGASVELVGEVIALDEQWSKTRHDLDMANGKVRALSKEIGLLYRAKKREEADAMKADVAVAKQDVEHLKLECVRIESERQQKLSLIGNLVHCSVPVSNDEVDNRVVRKSGKFALPAVKHVRHHHELLWMVGGYDPKRGAKVAGHRGYFLSGVVAQLNLALIQYGLEFLSQREFTPLTTPFMMNRDVMAKTAQLDDFDDQLYKVEVSPVEKYLIATSEQPISAYHEGEWLQPTELPKRYAGASTCFRKEAGKAGKDVWGIFRVHQFDKVEQFCVTAPDESWAMHEQITRNAEQFLESLGLPYRTVVIVSGELNNAAAKKYDIEAWFPAFRDFRELVSSSNCTDYQSRSLEVRFGAKIAGEEKKYVHMLNSTLCATTRAISCILENWQTDTGVIVPPVLRSYLGGIDFMPFVNEAPINVAAIKAAKAHAKKKQAPQKKKQQQAKKK
jgi:seryl-tRNA synthetase